MALRTSSLVTRQSINPNTPELLSIVSAVARIEFVATAIGISRTLSQDINKRCSTLGKQFLATSRRVLSCFIAETIPWMFLGILPRSVRAANFTFVGRPSKLERCSSILISSPKICNASFSDLKCHSLASMRVPSMSKMTDSTALANLDHLQNVPRVVRANVQVWICVKFSSKCLPDLSWVTTMKLRRHKHHNSLSRAQL